jgi:hypothetical protein
MIKLKFYIKKEFSICKFIGKKDNHHQLIKTFIKEKEVEIFLNYRLNLYLIQFSKKVNNDRQVFDTVKNGKENKK